MSLGINRVELIGRLGADVTVNHLMNVGALGGMPGEPLRIELPGERHARPGSLAEHRMSLAGVITFGGP